MDLRSDREVGWFELYGRGAWAAEKVSRGSCSLRRAMLSTDHWEAVGVLGSSGWEWPGMGQVGIHDGSLGQ